MWPAKFAVGRSERTSYLIICPWLEQMSLETGTPSQSSIRFLFSAAKSKIFERLVEQYTALTTVTKKGNTIRPFTYYAPLKQMFLHIDRETFNFLWPELCCSV
jgi:hypothetical protein